MLHRVYLLLFAGPAFCATFVTDKINNNNNNNNNECFTYVLCMNLEHVPDVLYQKISSAPFAKFCLKTGRPESIMLQNLPLCFLAFPQFSAYYACFMLSRYALC